MQAFCCSFTDLKEKQSKQESQESSSQPTDVEMVEKSAFDDDDEEEKMDID